MSEFDPSTVSIRDESIRLGQLLKLANLVEDGLEAKSLIEQGLVSVNGEVETRRGRQVRGGDTVTLDEATLTVVSAGA
ncbi:RNA-binding S4 domain-containing protein [Zhihengliuella somnathii]